MAMEGKKLLPDETSIRICPSDEETKHLDSTYETKLPYEGSRVASDVDGPGAEENCRNTCIPDSLADLDLEGGFLDVKVFVRKSEMACRICSSGFESSGPELGAPIALGCSCKGDLAFAHQKCAETWFNIRGNKDCEICGSKVKDLVGFKVIESSEKSVEPSNNTATATGTHRCCEGHRLLSCLLVAMLVAIFVCLPR